jgi:hypothetical protein
MQGTRGLDRYVIERRNNVVLVDFRRPDPPAPDFPGAGALKGGTPGNNESPAVSRKQPRRRDALLSPRSAALLS